MYLAVADREDGPDAFARKTSKALAQGMEESGSIRILGDATTTEINAMSLNALDFV